MTDENIAVSSNQSNDSTELYYAEMEAARHESEAAYFSARSSLQTGGPQEELWRALYRAGFERAFHKLWNERRSVETAERHTSMDYGGVGQVGCEGADGMLRIHRKNETCDVCAPEKAGETAAAQAPIARLKVWENLNGTCVSAELYAPGLPPGEHDLYCEPEATAPYLRAEETADEPPVMGGTPAPMPTTDEAIAAHVRQIQMLCDASGRDPAQWLSDEATGGCL